MVTVSFINSYTGATLADGITVKFYAASDTSLTTVLDTQTTSGSRVKTSALLIGDSYQYVLSGVGAPTTSTHTFNVGDVITAANFSPAQSPAGSSGGASSLLFFETYEVAPNNQITTSGLTQGDFQGAIFTSDYTTSGLVFTVGTGTNPDTISVPLPALPAGFDCYAFEVQESCSLTSAGAFNTMFQQLVTVPSSLATKEQLTSMGSGTTTGDFILWSNMYGMLPSTATVLTWKYHATANGVNNANSIQINGSIKVHGYKYQGNQKL